MTTSINALQQAAIQSRQASSIVLSASPASLPVSNLPSSETWRRIYPPGKVLKQKPHESGIIRIGSNWVNFSQDMTKIQLEPGTVIQDSLLPGIFVLMELPERPTAWLNEPLIVLDGGEEGSEWNAMVLTGKTGTQIRVIDHKYIIAGNIRYQLKNMAITVGQARAREFFEGNDKSERFFGARPDQETLNFLKRHKLLPSALLAYLGSSTAESDQEQTENTGRIEKGDRWSTPDDIRTAAGNDLITAHAGLWMGGEGSDCYIIMQPSCFGQQPKPDRQVEINNYAVDGGMDTLRLPVKAEELRMWLKEKHLMLAFQDEDQWVICQLTDFTKNDHQQHLQILDKTDRVFDLVSDGNQVHLLRTDRQFIPQITSPDSQATREPFMSPVFQGPCDVMADTFCSWPDGQETFTVVDIAKDWLLPAILLISLPSA